MQDTMKNIAYLKKQKNAVILAHFYQPPEIQQIADFVGDSLELARRAKDSDAQVIVFCGVYFMAESAKILSPQKTVLIPDKRAGCPMADMLQPQHIIALRRQYPSAAVVTYINSSAAVKAHSDICCTSSNAVRLVESLPSSEIIFLPDKNLGSYVARFSDKKFIYFNGYCPVHNRISPEDVTAAKAAHPGAELLVHPECPPDVVDLADFTGSTSGIINHATTSTKKEFIIGTEEGILYELKRQNPDKNFYMLTNDFLCADMKKISLQDVERCLETGSLEVLLDKKIIALASSALEKMLKVR